MNPVRRRLTGRAGRLRGSSPKDWAARQHVGRIDFLREYGANVFRLEPMLREIPALAGRRTGYSSSSHPRSATRPAREYTWLGYRRQSAVLVPRTQLL